MSDANRHLADEKAQLLVDGALPAGELDEATAHVASCPRCAVLVDAYRELSRSLETLPLPDLPADFTEGVLRRVEERERSVARERGIATAIVLGVLAALVAALLLGGNQAWAPSVTRTAGQLGLLADVLRLSSGVVSPLVNTLRMPIAAGCAALALPLLLALSRLLGSPRPQAA